MMEIVREVEGVKDSVLYTAGEMLIMGLWQTVVEDVKVEKVKREAWSVEKLKSDLETNLDNNIVRKYQVVCAEGRGVSWDEETAYNRQNGIKLEVLRDWTIRNMKDKAAWS